MGHNPRFGRWTASDWQGYCPTIGDMARRGWSLTARCRRCELELRVDVEVIIKVKGHEWSPWGRSTRCKRLHCPGAMRLRAYSPRAGQFVDV